MKSEKLLSSHTSKVWVKNLWNKNIFREEKYNVETLLAMILWNAKKVTEAYADQTVKVIIVWKFFDKMAELNREKLEMEKHGN